MKNITKYSFSFLSLFTLSIFMVAVVFAAETVLVSGNTSLGENQPGWLFNRDVSTSTPYEFNTDEASIGIGSLYVLPIGATPANKFIAENFLNTAIADIDTISYDFMLGAGDDTREEHFYMNVYANFGVSSDFKFYDCRYSVVPTLGSTAGFTTVTFDPTQAYPVTQSGTSPFSCPSIPAEMDNQSLGSTVRMFALNVGDTSASDIGLDGYLDNVVVSLTSGQTIYNFDPALTPLTREECKKDGWMTFNSPSFANQGECVSYVSSNGASMNNPGHN